MTSTWTLSDSARHAQSDFAKSEARTKLRAWAKLCSMDKAFCEPLGVWFAPVYSQATISCEKIVSAPREQWGCFLDMVRRRLETCNATGTGQERVLPLGGLVGPRLERRCATWRTIPVGWSLRAQKMYRYHLNTVDSSRLYRRIHGGIPA